MEKLILNLLNRNAYYKQHLKNNILIRKMLKIVKIIINKLMVWYYKLDFKMRAIIMKS